MTVLLGTIWLASLLGSLHCVGMCGPFALLAGAHARTPVRAIRPAILYSLGRLITYSIVGLLFGILGLALNQGTSFAAWQQSATYVAGGMMIAVGIIALARQFGFRVPLPRFPASINQRLGQLHQWAQKQQPGKRAILIGGLSSLMPCGWLYTFAIVAAGTGSPLWGMAVMAVFWAGTVPIMLALMLGFGKIGSTFQQKVPLAMATLVILIGVFTVTFRAPVAIGGDTVVESDLTRLSQQVESIDHSTLPCCNE